MANSGVFNIEDINFLKDNQQYPTLGQLELIQTQTGSSGSADIMEVNFTNIKESEYNVHFLTFSKGKSDGYQYLSLRFGNDGTYTTSGYKYAAEDFQSSNSFSEKKSTSDTHLRIGAYVYQGENAYAYIYNIGDSTKYTYTTFQNASSRANNDGLRGQFGSGLLPTASSFNNIQIRRTSTVGWYNFKASLYGIRFA